MDALTDPASVTVPGHNVSIHDAIAAFGLPGDMETSGETTTDTAAIAAVGLPGDAQPSGEMTTDTTGHDQGISLGVVVDVTGVPDEPYPEIELFQVLLHYGVPEEPIVNVPEDDDIISSSGEPDDDVVALDGGAWEGYEGEEEEEEFVSDDFASEHGWDPPPDAEDDYDNDWDEGRLARNRFARSVYGNGAGASSGAASQRRHPLSAGAGPPTPTGRREGS